MSTAQPAQIISKVHFEHKSATNGQLQGRFRDPNQQGAERDVTFLARMQPPSGFATYYVLKDFNIPPTKIKFGVLNPDTQQQTWVETLYTVAHGTNVSAHIIYTESDKVKEGELEK